MYSAFTSGATAFSRKTFSKITSRKMTLSRAARNIVTLSRTVHKWWQQNNKSKWHYILPSAILLTVVRLRVVAPRLCVFKIVNKIKTMFVLIEVERSWWKFNYFLSLPSLIVCLTNCPEQMSSRLGFKTKGARLRLKFSD